MRVTNTRLEAFIFGILVACYNNCTSFFAKAYSSSHKNYHARQHQRQLQQLLQQDHEQQQLTRRNFVTSAAGTLTAGVLAGSSTRSVALAEEGDVDVDENVYFGVGCFWHIQHEFVMQGEKDMLGRSNNEFTSRAGYAGGTKTDGEGRVCYHNFQSIADYGKFGHGEVVGMTIPRSKIEDFSKLYFSLFNPTTKNRVDPQDRGGEYRSLIGLPGGTNHPEYAKVENAAKDAGFTLKPGKGNDPDTLNQALVYVYDTQIFPFYQAEVYHQYHNDFQSPAYGREYNNLVNLALDDGRIQGTGCPDRI